MMTNSKVLLSKGMDCLSDTLGLVEAERFISLIKSEPFDYTEWRRDNLWNNISVEQLSKEAGEYRRLNG
ncbi:MAG: hypothetical protein FWD34_05630 [Oscillospiraceae bacterium]|nr:hypothetical protein [Oscillospiraceae bacterium]